MAFKKGTEVEVTSVDDGFRGVWYVAKITEPPKKSDDNEGFVVVEYNELVYEEDQSKKLSERVHVSLVRPLPPPMINDNNDGAIDINDVVDVFHKDGWWVGVVVEVVDKDQFLVYFDDPPDSMVVNKLDVRLHLDWNLGTWQKPKKINKIRDSSRLAMPSDHPDNSKKQNRSAKKQQEGKSFASTEKKDTGLNDEIVEKEGNAKVDMPVKERKGLSAKNCETPPKKVQKNKILDQEMHTVDDSSRPATLFNQSGYSRRQKTRSEKQQAGKSCASKEKMATSLHGDIVEKECNAQTVNMSLKEVGLPAKSCETPSNKDQMNKSMDQEMHTVGDSSRFALPSNHSGNSKRVSRWVKKQQDEKGCVSTEKKDNTALHADIVEKECITEVVKGALSAKDCEASRKKYQKKQSTEQEITTVDSTNGSTQGDVSSKRKRGKQIGKVSTESKRSLRKTIIEESCVGDEAKINAESDCLMQIAVNDKSIENHFQPSTNDRMKVSADKKHTSGGHKQADLLCETAIIPLPEDQAAETVPSKRVRQSKNLLSNGHEAMSKLVDKCWNASQGNTSIPEIYHKEDGDTMDGNHGDLNDDQLSNSILLVDKPSSMGSDASRTLLVQRQCANPNGRQDEFGTGPAAEKDRIVNTDGATPGDLPVKFFNPADKYSEHGTPARESIDNMEKSQSLPFTKCSPLWKVIESMDIYKSMAQRPHFSPLIKCHEETREGFAIAHMVNFSNLVEKTRTLQFSHPITIIEGNLETLAELETNGFDVTTIRACLTQLLLKKQIGEELQKECHDIESEISNNFNEKQKVDEEITQLDLKMNELVAKLGDAVNRKELKERVISTLKSKQDVVRQNIQGLELDFQSIAGSLR